MIYGFWFMFCISNLNLLNKRWCFSVSCGCCCPTTLDHMCPTTWSTLPGPCNPTTWSTLSGPCNPTTWSTLPGPMLPNYLKPHAPNHRPHAPNHRSRPRAQTPCSPCPALVSTIPPSIFTGVAGAMVRWKA